MKIRTHVLVLCGLLTVQASATLRADEGDLRFTVPFTFAAGLKTLPAGTYTLSPVPLDHGVLFIRGTGGGAFVSSPEAEDAGTESPRLVFNRYGDHYFLRSVHASDRSYALPETRQEREASTERRGMQASNPEVVAVRAAVR